MPLPYLRVKYRVNNASMVATSPKRTFVMISLSILSRNTVSKCTAEERLALAAVTAVEVLWLFEGRQ